MSRTIVYTESAPNPIGPYSQAIRSGDMVFTAGQIGLNPSGELADGVHAQTMQAVTNLQQVLGAAGATLANVVKTTIFLKDMNDFATVNEAYAQFFSEICPARSTVQVARLPKDALVEIEAIAQITDGV